MHEEPTSQNYEMNESFQFCSLLNVLLVGENCISRSYKLNSIDSTDNEKRQSLATNDDNWFNFTAYYFTVSD